MIVLTSFRTIVAEKFPLVDQMLRISAFHACDALHIHKTIRYVVLAVTQCAQLNRNDYFLQNLIEAFLRFTVDRRSALDGNNFQHDRLIGRWTLEHKHFAEDAFAYLNAIRQLAIVDPSFEFVVCVLFERMTRGEWERRRRKINFFIFIFYLSSQPLIHTILNFLTHKVEC